MNHPFAAIGIVLALFLFAVYIAATYDISSDSSMHTCTEECILEGCPFEDK